MKARGIQPQAATRSIGASTGFEVSSHYIMAALSGGAALGIAWAFDARWNVVSDSPDFNPFIVLVAFLGFFALKFPDSAIRGTLLARRFGASTLEMEGESVPLGGTLKGRILTSAALAPTAITRSRCAASSRSSTPGCPIRPRRGPRTSFAGRRCASCLPIR